MITTLESTTSQYEQVLHSALTTAINGNDLVSALSSIDENQQADRLKFILRNYTKTHSTSSLQGGLIEQAIATL